MVLGTRAEGPTLARCVEPSDWVEARKRELEIQTRLQAVSRKLLIVLLILLVLLVAPLGMGMAMGMCPNSHWSTCDSTVGVCAAIVGLILLLPISILGAVTSQTSLARVLLLAPPLKPPPRPNSL